MFLWTKSVRAGGVEAWIERLGPAVAPERLVVVSPANRLHARLEVYCEAEAEARGLAQRFGGMVRAVQEESWQPPPATAPGHPLRIAGRLWITGREEELSALRASHPDQPTLCIPAAMAFGTGEHATTGMCLRLLAEAVRRRRTAGTSWELLDLGSGSGILALAGRMFGASSALGLDNDPHAVRTARGNAMLNGVRRVRFQRADLLAGWQPEPARWPVITANLFSELLTALLPRIREALAGGGCLIASGVLASQAVELEKHFRKNDLRLVTRRRRGKWTAFLVCPDDGVSNHVSGTTASPTRKRPPGSA